MRGMSKIQEYKLARGGTKLFAINVFPTTFFGKFRWGTFSKKKVEATECWGGR